MQQAFADRHYGLELRWSPSSGWGVFTTREIENGKLVMWEHPMIVCPPGSDPVPDIVAATERFTQEEWQRFHELHNATASSPLSPTGQIMAIFRTNAFGNEEEGWELLYDISRINHSCEPNAGIFCGRDRNQLSLVVASQDIPVGAEITLGYIDEDADLEVRAATLSTKWQFSCACTRCVRERAEKEKEKEKEMQEMLDESVVRVKRAIEKTEKK